MPPLRSLSLIPLWLRLKRLLRSVLIKGASWQSLTNLYSIINDYLSLTRKPTEKTPPPIEPTPPLDLSPPTPSPSGPQDGAPSAPPTKPEYDQLY